MLSDPGLVFERPGVFWSGDVESGDGEGDSVSEESVAPGTNDMHRVPEKRTTDIARATGSTAEYGFG